MGGGAEDILGDVALLAGCSYQLQLHLRNEGKGTSPTI